jgi:diacylglycerol kinase (ATP)
LSQKDLPEPISFKARPRPADAGGLARFAWSFRYAGAGVTRLLREQPNARIHLAATILVVVLGVVLKVDRVEAGLLALAVGLVWSAEALNTAIESLADALHPEHDPQIGRAKDAAAGGVLLAALASAALGAIIFLPKIAAFMAM